MVKKKSIVGNWSQCIYQGLSFYFIFEIRCCRIRLEIELLLLGNYIDILYSCPSSWRARLASIIFSCRFLTYFNNCGQERKRKYLCCKWLCKSWNTKFLKPLNLEDSISVFRSNTDTVQKKNHVIGLPAFHQSVYAIWHYMKVNISMDWPSTEISQLWSLKRKHYDR